MLRLSIISLELAHIDKTKTQCCRLETLFWFSVCFKNFTMPCRAGQTCWSVEIKPFLQPQSAESLSTKYLGGRKGHRSITIITSLASRVPADFLAGVCQGGKETSAPLSLPLLWDFWPADSEIQVDFQTSSESFGCARTFFSNAECVPIGWLYPWRDRLAVPVLHRTCACHFIIWDFPGKDVGAVCACFHVTPSSCGRDTPHQHTHVGIGLNLPQFLFLPGCSQGWCFLASCFKKLRQNQEVSCSVMTLSFDF